MYSLAQAQKSNSTVNFFLNGAESSFNSVNSANSENLINQSSMNWAEFKKPLSHVCLAGAVVGSILGSNTRDGRFKPFYCNNKLYFVTEFSEFRETMQETSILSVNKSIKVTLVLCSCEIDESFHKCSILRNNSSPLISVNANLQRKLPIKLILRIHQKKTLMFWQCNGF